ncbi:MAG: hypothetical protein GY775_16675 [Candidatus Scalindua sp.]|nr:hypothetical protein [Candidatus Scalindua sp.]
MKENLTLIDTTSLFYVVCSTTMNKFEITDNFQEYKDRLHTYIDNILEETKADKYILFGDGKSSFRKAKYPSVKSDRKFNYLKFKNDLIQHALDSLDLFISESLESDDMCLIVNNELKSTYNVTIASIDSDLRQAEGIFYNYGWRRGLIAKYQSLSQVPEEVITETIEKSFEILSKDEADFNLWSQVLKAGHNNKKELGAFLKGCGESCATNYLKTWLPSQYKYAVLKAFIYGIDKNKDKGLRTIKGYGNIDGIDKFNTSFQLSYLLRNLKEVESLGIEFKIPELQTFTNKNDRNQF